MKKPVHFDVAALERALRELHATNIAAARVAAKTDRDRELVDLQGRLFEILVSAHVTLATFRNEGRDTLLVAQAFGGIIGSCAGAFIENNPGDATQAFAHYLNDMVRANARRQSPKNATGMHRQFAGTVGGNG
ncbi:MAG: hypothetical protein KG075_07435 [Alphaproteobacteria bacterium]|nr:hypothetical protein [Alphaproteobacteria bacterium]